MSLMSQKTSLEVEKKFQCTDAIQYTVQSLASHCKMIDMIDTYFDMEDYSLSCKDMWMRKRNAVVELKWPHQFDVKNQTISDDMAVPFATDFYNESTNKSAIAKVVQQQCISRNIVDFELNSDWNVWMTSAGIAPFATIRSQRTRYNLTVPITVHVQQHTKNVLQNICVDIDEVTYFEGQPTSTAEESSSRKGTYMIGEVELAADKDSVCFTQEDKVAVMKEVFRLLGISPQPVRGKVLEFLFRYRPKHYQALRDCGQLASKGL